MDSPPGDRLYCHDLFSFRLRHRKLLEIKKQENRLSLYLLVQACLTDAMHLSKIITVIRFFFVVKIFYFHTQKKCTKIFNANIILQRNTQYFPNCCCPYILVYVVASKTRSHLLFTSYLQHAVQFPQIMLTTCDL